MKFNILLPFLLGGALVGSLLTSCEDKCTNCDCEGLFIDKIVSSDSLDTGLGQLTSNTTVVILGSGLSNVGEAYFLDSKNIRYDIILNPSYVTDNSIIITLDSDADFKPTDRLVLKSKNGCEIVTNIEKPVPAPAIQRFRSEFVQDGDTLRIAGSAFLPTSTTPVSVFFYTNEQGTDSIEVKSGLAAEGSTVVKDDSKDLVRIKNDNKELLVVVPLGVVDSKPIRITTEYGSTLSKILFRDNRNVFMNFDEETKTPIAHHGSLSLDATAEAPAWDNQLLTGDRSAHYSERFANFKFPKPCNGRYSALTYLRLYDMLPDQQFTYMQYKDYQTANNLLGQFQGESIESLVLKFEMLIPKEFPFYDVFYLGFTASKTEMEDMSLLLEAYPWATSAEWHPRALFTYDNLKNAKGEPTCDASLLPDGEPHSGVPAAWFHPGKIGYDKQPAFKVKEFTKESAMYHTEGEWLTVTIPLTDNYFNAPVAKMGFKTIESERVCNKLQQTDFYNFFFCAEGTFMADLGADLYYFAAFDNFRIVPNDGGGTRFQRFDGVDPSAMYPYSVK